MRHGTKEKDVRLIILHQKSVGRTTTPLERMETNNQGARGQSLLLTLRALIGRVRFSIFDPRSEKQTLFGFLREDSFELSHKVARDFLRVGVARFAEPDEFHEIQASFAEFETADQAVAGEAGSTLET
jgi:hypothetical protein